MLLAKVRASQTSISKITTGGQGACGPPFFMSTPTIEQVMQNGALVWRVHHAGMTREFREDWRARWHYEQCIRLSRNKKTGKSG